MNIFKRCPVCGLDSHTTVPDMAYFAWLGGMLAQDAFPDVPPAMREQIISGTHPDCFDAMFSKEEQTP